MRKDPTEFRQRFAAWKNGEKVYKDGLPAYRDGKDGGKINYSRWDNAELTSYPVPFIDEKRITLTNAGRATGAVLSTNLLDSIADNANRAGLPLLTALGLAVKETTLGNPTDDRTAWNLSSGIRQAFNNKYPGTELHINYWGDALNEREDVINYHKGHLSDDPASGHKSVLLEAFEFYNQHPDKYNPGQKNYPLLVDKRGTEVMGSPEVLKWLKERNLKKATGRFNRINPLLNESKFNLPKYRLGTEGDDIEELIRKRLEQRSDNTSVKKEPVYLSIKREYGKIVDHKLVERLLRKLPVIKQGKSYTERRVDEENNKRTWRSEVADQLHGAGEGALFASNFIPFSGELFSGGRSVINNLRSYLLHPNYKTVYHGSPYQFDIKNAWNATSNDIGLHVAENKITADIMKDGGVTYKLRIPKENTQTIDIGRNGANQLSESYHMKAHPKENYWTYYDTSVGDDFRINTIRSAGGLPSVNLEHTKLYLENPVNINIRKLAFPNIKMKDLVEADNILRSYNALFDSYTELPLNFKMVKLYNQQAADLLSRNGYKVIKYHNANPFEGGGTSYMITDPSVMDVMENISTESYPAFLGAFGGFGINKKYAE